MKRYLVWPLITVATAALALRLGTVDVDWLEVWAWLNGAGEEMPNTILTHYRAPRVLAAGLVGAHLAVSGLILQVILRNPLADPTIFGVSAGASVAVVASMSIGFALAPPTNGIVIPSDYVPISAVPFIALAGALSATGIMMLLAWDGGFQPRRMALTGVVLGAVLAAVVMAMVLSLPEAQTQLAVLWLAGSLYGRDFADIWPILPWTMLGLAAATACLRPLSVLRFDPASAQSMGIDSARLRFWLVFIAAALAASAVAIAGPVGFVGLLVPHVARLLAGPDLSSQFWLNIWAGALLVIASDAVGRVIISPVEMPVGIVTSLIGAPFFIYLLSRKSLG
ncbi:MAG: iron ABC transporter permease [Pseudomonadota bacterium]